MDHHETRSGPRVGCGVALVVDGRILLVRRTGEPEAGYWGLPGGKVDPFEPCHAAASRETWEELGIVVHLGPENLLCVVDQIDTEAGTHWVAPVYLSGAFTGTPTIREPDKHHGLSWFALRDLPSPVTIATRTAIGVLLDRDVVERAPAALDKPIGRAGSSLLDDGGPQWPQAARP